jgi:hypothetical protein
VLHSLYGVGADATVTTAAKTRAGRRISPDRWFSKARLVPAGRAGVYEDIFSAVPGQD